MLFVAVRSISSILTSETTLVLLSCLTSFLVFLLCKKKEVKKVTKEAVLLLKRKALCSIKNKVLVVLLCKTKLRTVSFRRGLGHQQQSNLDKPLTNLDKPLTNLDKPLTNLDKPLTNLVLRIKPMVC